MMLLSASLTPLAGAQSTSPSGEATVRGTVRDSQHHPVVGAEVCLQATASAQSWRTRTDSSGAFRFSSLPAGSYTVRVEMAEKGKARSAAVSLGTNDTKTIDLTLSTSSLAFFDEPTFSVAGVTDTSNLGGHGSDTVVRNRNALAKATVSLSKDTVGDATANTFTPEKTLREMLQHDPSSFAANYGLGKLLVANGRGADAKPYLVRAIELESSAERHISAQDKAALHHLLGDVAEKTGDPLEAVREYQRAAEFDASETNVFDWGAELLLHHAPEPAAEVFTNGHRAFPRSVRMLVGLSVAWYVQGSYEQAAWHLCEASDLDPSDPTPYLFLGKIQSVEGSVSEGIADRLQRFATLEPQNAMANYYYAVSLWKQRKGPDDAETAAKAQALLEKATTVDPKLGEAFLQLGIVEAERKDFPKAIAAYQRAIQANPRLEQAHYRLAQAYRISGQNDKARDELKLYEEISKEKAAEVERERSDVKQFVYTMRAEKLSLPQP